MINNTRLKKIRKKIKNYPFFELLGFGKRGVVYKISPDLAVKIERDDSPSKGSLKNEYDILKLLNPSNYFPKPIFFDDKLKYLIRGLAKGKRIDAVDNNKLFLKAMMIARELDLKKINQEEMNNPYKHIYFFNKKPMMIDFERAKTAKNPKNVSQFCQYICNKCGLDHKILIPFIKKYKEDYSAKNFKEIMGLLTRLLSA